MKLSLALLLVAATVANTAADKKENNKLRVSSSLDQPPLAFVKLTSLCVCMKQQQNNKQRKLQTAEYPESFTMGSSLETPNCTVSEACYETEKETIARAIQAELDAAEAAAGVSRRLDSTSENNYYPHEYYGSAEDFVGTCYALTGNSTLNNERGWIRLPDQDDVSTEITLPWAFNFFGKTYPIGTKVYINTNGLLSFEGPQFYHGAFAGYNPTIFPIRETVIAPFWADVDTRPPTPGALPHGEMWYRFSEDENTLSVIWDRVGYYSQKGNRRNTFQVVISDSTWAPMGINTNTGGYNNICFCYGDMEWTTGIASFGRDGLGNGFGTPAVVGINRGRDERPITSPFGPSQMFGQFSFGNSMAWDGVGTGPDGIDFLDNRGTTFQRVSLEPICFDAHENLPPVCTGFPVNNTVSAICNTPLNLMLSFATPELDQTISASYTGTLPPGATITETTADTVVTFELSYTPLPGQEGTYTIEFTAVDDYTTPATVTKTLTIVVPTCTDEDTCVPITPDDACDAFDPRPFCTPFRSPEFCPPDESFPDLIRTRNDISTDDAALIESQDFWFHYLNDKAAQYAFTASQGFNAPKLLCCVDDVNDLYSTCFGGASPPPSFVIRASGHHSGKGIFVLPEGFDGVELLSGIVKSSATIVAEIDDLLPAPDKILVEEFIPGDNGPASLPNEFKFHMFDNKIGAVTAIYNRGTDCACYAEFDVDFERLDQFGCFEPASPAQQDGACHKIDFDAGSQNPYQIKDLDICSDPLPPIPTCIWNDLRSAALSLGSTIGVYMRIDMFVSGDGLVYVQEYTPNHNGGLRHCTARRDPSGCVDSCFLGECWKDNGEKPNGSLVFGGPLTPEPTVIGDWTTKTASQQCGIANGQSPPNPAVSTCFTPP